MKLFKKYSDKSFSIRSIVRQWYLQAIPSSFILFDRLTILFFPSTDMGTSIFTITHTDIQPLPERIVLFILKDIFGKPAVLSSYKIATSKVKYFK